MSAQHSFGQQYARLGKSAAPQGRQVVNVQIQDHTRRRKATGSLSLEKSLGRNGGKILKASKEIADAVKDGAPGLPGVLYRYPGNKIKDTDYAPTIYTLTFVERSANRRGNPQVDRTGQTDPIIFSDWQGFIYDVNCEPYFAGVLEQKDHDLGANPHA